MTLPPTLRSCILLLAAGLLVVLAYLPGSGLDFIFDSRVAVSDNPAIQISGGRLEQWRLAALSSSSGALGRPLAMLSFAANHVVSGELSARAIKLTNVLIHLGNGLLIYLVLVTALRASTTLAWPSIFARRVALLTALLWLLHPLHVSTVLYAVQRMTQLSTLFTLLGLWVFLRARVRWMLQVPSLGELAALGAWLILITLLALYSKENGLLLLWFIPLFELMLFRGEWGGRRSTILRTLTVVAVLLPLLCAVVYFSANPFHLTVAYETREFDLGQRLFTQLRVMWQYVFWLGLPNIRSMGFHHDDIAVSVSLLQPLTTPLALVAWLTAVGLALALCRRSPLPLFGLCFFWIGHSLESTVFALELVYEHRNYLPSVGVLLLLAWVIVSLAERLTPSVGRLLMAGVLAVFLALLTVRSVGWSSEWQFATRHVQSHPSSARANYHIANVALRQVQGAPESPQAAEYLAVARHYYQQMYELAPQRLSALASLWFVDSAWLPQRLAENDWFGRLLNAARTTVFAPEDINAMALVTDCLVARLCKAPPAQVAELYATMIERSPTSPALLWQWARYQREVMADARAAELTLAKSVQQHPGYWNASRSLLEYYARRAEPALTIDQARQVLAADAGRRHLVELRNLFAVGKANE